MTFHYRYRKQIMLGIIALLFISGMVFLVIRNQKEEKEEIPTVELKKEEPKNVIEEILYKVDIKGEVNAPGIYTLSSNSRVIDVIEASGGLTENADTSVINLSKKISDEMVIIIYSRDQVKNFEETKKQEKIIQEKCEEPDENSLKNGACISNNETLNGKVNINTASKEELMSLNGIGESKADTIIQYREQSPFQTIEDLLKVPGIGENIFAQIKENIIV